MNAIGVRYLHLIPRFSDDPTHIIGYKLDAVSDPKISFAHLDMNPDHIKSIKPQILDHGPIDQETIRELEKMNVSIIT